MGQILSGNVATSLYWLGRYIARIEVMLLQITLAYDKIIDVEKEAGVVLYKKMGVDLEYVNAMDFLYSAILGNHVANLNATMGYAKENAIISRNYINIEAFGEIIALSALFKDASKKSVPVDYKFIDHVQSLINEIWGQFSKVKLRKKSDYFIRLGKFVEEVDFHLRFRNDEHLVAVVLEEINSIIDILSDTKEIKITQNELLYYGMENIMDVIHKKIEEIIVY